MRKVMMLAAMLAMALMAAAPAVAQDVQYSDDFVEAAQEVTQQCQQVIINIDQYSLGDDEVIAAIGDLAIDLGDCTLIVQQVAAGDDAVGAIIDVVGVTPPEQPSPEEPSPEQPSPEEPSPEEPSPEEPSPEEPSPAPGDEDNGNGDDKDDNGGDGSNGDNGSDDGNGNGSNGGVDGSDDGNGSVEDGDDEGDGSGLALLPDTGGASLLALGLGALLVAGGLLARRIVR